MFRELHHMNHDLRTMDLMGKMAERRRQSLAATGKPPLRTRVARMLSALAVATESSQAEGRA